jgi:molybdopterin-containing oxidoreductase family membrane subunit
MATTTIDARWPQKAFVVFTALTVIPGAVATVVRFSEGLSATRLGSTVTWGLWVALYIYYIGLSAGSFLLSTLVYVFGAKRFEPIGRMAIWQALTCLIIGLYFIFLDLGHPGRFWTVYVNQNWKSVLAWEIQFYGLYIVLLCAELYLLLRADLVSAAAGAAGWRKRLYRMASLGSKDASERTRARDHRWIRRLAILGIPIAIGVHGGTGAIFAVVKARPYWYSALFPVVFIVSALASGGALLLFVRAMFIRSTDPEDNKRLVALGRMTGGILIFDLFLLAVEFLVGMYGEIPDHVRTFRQIATGPFWWVFWVVQLGLGAVLPLALLFHPRAGQHRAWLGLAGLLIVAGIFGVRLNIVIPPFVTPPFESLPEVFHSARFATEYFPNWMEWGASVGAIAAGTLLFAAGVYALPMLPCPPQGSSGMGDDDAASVIASHAAEAQP